MDHEQRMKIARKIAALCKRRLGARLVAMAVYGSTARGEDGRYSDLELLGITSGRQEVVEKLAFLMRDIMVGVRFTPVWEARREAANLDLNWPEAAGGYMCALPLFDEAGVFRRLRRLIGSISVKRLQASASNELPTVYEYVGKARNAYLAGDRLNLFEAGISFAWCVAMFIALVNGRFYKSENTIFREYASFQYLPAGYGRLIHECRGHRNVAAAKLYKSILRLWRNTLVFASRFGIEPPTFRAISETTLRDF